MSSPEELTFIVGRRLRPVSVILDVVGCFGVKPTSSREQAGTKPNR
jgi:hypothetical protein